MKTFGLRAEQSAQEQTSYGHYCNKVKSLNLEPVSFVQFQNHLAGLFCKELNRKQRMEKMIEFTKAQQS